MSQNMSQNIGKDTERYGILSKTRVLEKRQNPTKQWVFWRFPKIVAEAEGFEPPWACTQTVFKTASL